VLSGITAEPITRADKAIAHLSRQIAETIVWKDCMDACAEAGVTVALELGPGAALSRMLQARHPQIACRSVADFRSLDGVRNWLVRNVD
jgi:[acyl-carrier-protein] S-malonyltransferase